MSKLWKGLVWILATIGLAGIPDDLKQWLGWIAAVDWDYWLDAGEWLPWSIRTVLITIGILLVLNPEWQIRARERLNPRWTDGRPVGIGFSWGWWLEGLRNRKQRERDRPKR